MFGSSLDRFIRRAVACYVVKADCADRRCGIEEKGLQEILLGRKMVPPLSSSRPARTRLPTSSLRHIHGRENVVRSEEHTSELQSLMRHSYAVFCLKKKKKQTHIKVK